MFLLPHLLSQLTELTATHHNEPISQVTENHDAYLIHVELPGARQETLKVELNGDLLSVEVSRPSPANVEQGELLWSELDLHDRTLRYRLPRGLSREEISATLTDGLLTLRLAKATPARREIPVNQAPNAAA